MIMSDLIIPKPYAECFEVKCAGITHTPQLRIYPAFRENDGFMRYSLQIFTHRTTCQSGKGKPRNMIAEINLSRAEVEQILRFIQDNERREA